jgi:hypothetical protein
MTDSDDPTGKSKIEQALKKRREEALPERILRRVLEGMGDVVEPASPLPNSSNA